MAKEHQADLLEAEAEVRAATLTPPPRDNSQFKRLAPHKDPNGKKLEDRLTPRMEDRLGARNREDRGDAKEKRAAETRECNACHKVGHLAFNYPTFPFKARLPGPPAGEPPKAAAPRPDYSKHKTEGATCSACKKSGHVAAQCWTAHPDLLPTDQIKRRQGAMATLLRKRQRAGEYASPEYDF